MTVIKSVLNLVTFECLFLKVCIIKNTVKPPNSLKNAKVMTPVTSTAQLWFRQAMLMSCCVQPTTKMQRYIIQILLTKQQIIRAEKLQTAHIWQI